MSRLMRMTSAGEVEMTQAEHDAAVADREAWAAAQPARLAAQQRENTIQDRKEEILRNQAVASLIDDGTFTR